MKVRIIPAEINYAGLPLFDYASAVQPRYRIAYAARWLRQRHPLAPERAALLARLAGLGGAE
jgi:hypothetical protein